MTIVPKFAKGINRSDNFVSELEKGRTSCSIYTLHQISKVLKSSTDDLMYGDTNKMKEKYDNKGILLEIIERCNNEELAVIKIFLFFVYFINIQCLFHINV